MLKKIKHIISICAVISLLAISFLGCKQPTTPELGQNTVKYTVTFQTDVGKAPAALKVDPDYELTAEDLTNISDVAYDFKGWFNGDSQVKAGYIVTKDVTLTAKWVEKNFYVDSLDFNKSYYYLSDKKNNAEVTVTIKGAGFTLLKKEPKQEIMVAFFENIDTVQQEPILKVPAEINYDTNTAIAKFNIQKLFPSTPEIVAETSLPETTEDSILPEDLGTDFFEFKSQVIVNDKPTELIKPFIITGRPYLTDNSKVYYNKSFRVYNDNKFNLYDLDNKTFELDIFAKNIKYTDIVIKVFNKDGIQEGEDNHFSILQDNLNNKYQELIFPFPKKTGEYTIKLFFDGIEQKHFYNTENKQTTLTANKVSVVDSTITSVSIPKSDIGMKGTNVDAIINGTYFSQKDTSRFTAECTTNSAITKNATFTYIDDTKFKVSLKIPDTAGEYPITIKKGTQTVTEKLVIEDSVSVTFVSEHGSVPEKKTGLTKGSVFNIPADLSARGYTFAGWYKDNSKVTEGLTLDSSITLTARWTPIEYTITYNNCTDIDNNDNPSSYTIEDSINFKSPIKSGFRFDGWFEDSNCTGNKITYIFTGTTENQTLYAKWTDITPAEVSNFKATIEGNNTLLSWGDPADKDFKEVIITYSGNTNNVSKGIGKLEIANSISTDYTVKTVDNAGNTSTGVTIKSLTTEDWNKPRVVRTVDIGGTTYDIVEFGQWPQTVKAESVTIAKTQSAIKINGWDCYLGSDKYYYTKIEASTRNDPYFENGNNISSGTSYYFKLEPIEWRVLTNNYNNSGKKLLLAENALMTGKFDEGAGNYSGSEIRARLNGLDQVVTTPNIIGSDSTTNYNGCGFLQKAFSASQLEYIADTQISDADGSTVTDKIFLVSKADTENSTFGFSNEPSRQRLNTDYIRATGGWEDSGNRNGWWWHREGGRITKYGEFDNFGKKDAATSIVPAICIN